MGPEIVLLDDNADLRQILTLYISHHLHLNCAGFSSFKEIEKVQSAFLSSSIAILDIELGVNEPSGIDVYRWMMKNNYRGRIFFLTGHGPHDPRFREAMGLKAPILEKPISGQNLVHLLKPLLHQTIETQSH